MLRVGIRRRSESLYSFCEVSNFSKRNGLDVQSCRHSIQTYNNNINKIASVQKNHSERLEKVPPLPQPEPIRTLPETTAPKPTVSAATPSTRSSYTVVQHIEEQKQPDFMSKEERRKELLKIARSAEKLFIRRLTD